MKNAILRLLICVGILFLDTSFSEAQGSSYFKVCNHERFTVYVAQGTLPRVLTSAQSEGWEPIRPQRCKTYVAWEGSRYVYAFVAFKDVDQLVPLQYKSSALFSRNLADVCVPVRRTPQISWRYRGSCGSDALGVAPSFFVRYGSTGTTSLDLSGSGSLDGLVHSREWEQAYRERFSVGSPPKPGPLPPAKSETEDPPRQSKEKTQAFLEEVLVGIETELPGAAALFFALASEEPSEPDSMTSFESMTSLIMAIEEKAKTEIRNCLYHQVMVLRAQAFSPKELTEANNACFYALKRGEVKTCPLVPVEFMTDGPLASRRPDPPVFHPQVPLESCRKKARGLFLKNYSFYFEHLGKDFE